MQDSCLNSHLLFVFFIKLDVYDSSIFQNIYFSPAHLCIKYIIHTIYPLRGDFRHFKSAHSQIVGCIIPPTSSHIILSLYCCLPLSNWVNQWVNLTDADSR